MRNLTDKICLHSTLLSFQEPLVWKCLLILIAALQKHGDNI